MIIIVERNGYKFEGMLLGVDHVRSLIEST